MFAAAPSCVLLCWQMVCSWLRSAVDAAGELERVVLLFDDDEQAATEHRSATTAIVAKADLNNVHQVLLPAAVDEIDAEIKRCGRTPRSMRRFRVTRLAP